MVSYEALKVFNLFLVWCSLGLFLEIPGPTMIDVRLIFNATYEDVSRSVSGRGAGGFTGALIGGFLVDKFTQSLDLFIGIGETIAAVAIYSLPMSHNIDTVWFHYFTLGTCNGIISIAGIRSVIKLLPEKTTTTIMLLHVGFGLGALLVPILVNPFLAVLDYAVTPLGQHQSQTETFTVVKESSVHHAFSVIGMFTCVLSFVFYYYFFNPPKNHEYKKVGGEQSNDNQTDKSFKTMINPATYANGQFYYGLVIFILLFLYFFHLVGGEEVFGHFVRSFSVEVFQFSKTKASYLNTTYWLGLTVSRLVNSVLSNYITTKRLFMMQVIAHTVATTLLNIYASSSVTMLWICTFAEGFLISPLFPGGIAYGNTLIEVTGVCLMVIQFSSSVGDLSFIWIAGKLYESYGPKSVLYGLQLVGIILLVCAVAFRVAEKLKKPKVAVTIVSA